MHTTRGVIAVLLGLCSVHACSSTKRGSGLPTDAGSDADGSGSGGAAGGATAGAAGAASGSGGQGADGGAGGPADARPDVPELPCEPAALPGDGVFAARDGSDGTGDGSASFPVQTIARALDVAVATGKQTVYLGEGTYPEQVRFESMHGDIVLEGGWVRTGASWQHDCEVGVRARTLIASPDAVGVYVGQITARSGLRTLSVATKARGAEVDDTPGESLYGVFVEGPGVLFALENVSVEVGDAGNGGRASAVGPGLAANCTNLAQSCGDGSSAANAMSGADAPLGTFNDSGYVPASGEPGNPGPAGQNGTPGQPGETDNCFPGGCGCPSPSCSTNGNRSPKSGGSGTCGCGGKGGDGGAAGKGGGASVGVFAAGAGVIVSVSLSIVTAGAGGDGTPGTEGTLGASGGMGAPGGGGWCDEDCVVGSPGVNCVNDGCNQTGKPLAGGTAGGPAGKGGDGGRAGGGSGGPSFGVVAVSGASVITETTALVPGTPGAGGGAAPSGPSGEEFGGG